MTERVASLQGLKTLGHLLEGNGEDGVAPWEEIEEPFSRRPQNDGQVQRRRCTWLLRHHCAVFLDHIPATTNLLTVAPDTEFPKAQKIFSLFHPFPSTSLPRVYRKPVCYRRCQRQH